jgi:hypothetical protein
MIAHRCMAGRRPTVGNQQQVIGGYQGPSFTGVEHLKDTIGLADLSQGMIIGESLLNGDEGEQCATSLLLTSHRE